MQQSRSGGTIPISPQKRNSMESSFQSSEKAFTDRQQRQGTVCIRQGIDRRSMAIRGPRTQKRAVGTPACPCKPRHSRQPVLQRTAPRGLEARLSGSSRRAWRDSRRVRRPSQLGWLGDGAKRCAVPRTHVSKDGRSSQKATPRGGLATRGRPVAGPGAGNRQSRAVLGMSRGSGRGTGRGRSGPGHGRCRGAAWIGVRAQREADMSAERTPGGPLRGAEQG